MGIFTTGLITGGLKMGFNAANRGIDSLAYHNRRKDRIKFWRMQNEYNHPANQKKRIEQAGLNPALMYGKGGASGATPASSIDGPKPHKGGSEIDPSMEILRAQQIKQSKLATEMTEQKVMEQKIKNAIEAKKLPLRLRYYGSKDWETDFWRTGGDSKLGKTQYEIDNLELDKLMKLMYTGRGEGRKAGGKIAAEIAKLEAQTSGIKYDNAIKKITKALNELGIDWRDDVDLRVIGQKLHNDGVISLPLYLALSQVGENVIQSLGKQGKRRTDYRKFNQKQ